MSDFAAPHNDAEELHADSGDPNRDRADLAGQAPTQVDDDALAEHLDDVDDDAEHDAPTAAQ